MTVKGKVVRSLASKYTLICLLAVVALLSFYSVLAWTTPEQISFNEKIGSYGSKGILTHYALLKNNTLYGDTLEREEYPANLIKELNIQYNYSFEPNTSVDGKYVFVGKVVYYTTVDKKEAILWTDTLFDREGELVNGKFAESYNINITKLNSRIGNVSDQLGVRRLNHRILFETTVFIAGNVDGKAVNETFEHEMEFVQDPIGLFYFKNTEKTDTKSVIQVVEKDRFLSFAGFSTKVSTARMVFPLLLTAFIPPFAFSLYSNYSRLKSRRIKGIDKYVVDGRPINLDKVVMLTSEEDLKRTLELVDKPIIRFRCNSYEIYTIIDDGMAYTYKRKIAEEAK